MTTSDITFVCGHCLRTISPDAYLVDGMCPCGQLLSEDTVLVFEDLAD